MLNLSLTQSLATTISLFCAYLISVPLTGAFQAWVSKKMGDDAAQEAGFLSFNPMVHIDPIGMILLVIFGIGWGKQIPSDAHAIKNSHRILRLILVHSAETLMSLCIALSSLLIMILSFGLSPLFGAFEMFFSGNVPIHTFANLWPQASSLSIAAILLLMALVFFNIFIATLSFVTHGIRFALVLGFERGYDYVEYADYLIFLAPIIILLFFADTLRGIFMYSIVYGAYMLGYLLGAF